MKGFARRASSWGGLACASYLVCSVARAEPSQSARELFARGVEQAQRGELDAAAANFERAYQQSPHYAVLFNLGQAYTTLGRPVEAVRAFEKYLEGGGKKITPERQAEVRQLIRISKKRIGDVSFAIDPPSAKLSIDGKEIDAASLSGPVSLSTGTHGVAVTLQGFETFVSSVNVEAQQTAVLEVRLTRAPEPAPLAAAEPARIGQIAVDSELPDLQVSLDGVAVARVGNEPFLAQVGHHQILCQRDGYLPFTVELEVAEYGVARLDCSLLPAAKLQPSQVGLLNFDIDQPHASVWVDGRRASANTRLPTGRHFVRIRRFGFQDWTRTVTVRSGFPQTIAVQLRMTPEHAEELARTASTRRKVAYVLGGTGLALLGTSAALYATNNARYDDWLEGSRDLQTATSIQRQDDAAVALALAGGTLVGCALVSWFAAR